MTWTKNGRGTWRQSLKVASSNQGKTIIRAVPPPLVGVKRNSLFKPSKDIIANHRDAIVEFVGGEFDGSLESVPGIDIQLAEVMEETTGINNGYALIGKFLSFRKVTGAGKAGKESDMSACCHDFADFLSEAGCEDADIATVITVAIGMKANYGTVGSFDAACYRLGLTEE
jgi:hypothetical protein